MKTFAFYVTSESGDTYDGYFRCDGSDREKALAVVQACAGEIEGMLAYDDNLTIEWAMENPEEALEEALFHPNYIEIN